MATWSGKRKLFYSSLLVGVVVFFVAFPILYFSYKAPTCFDGIRNGDEQNIDCGGSCVRLCQSSFLPPRIVWGGAKLEKVADGLYNVASLIENKNIAGAAVNVPYKVSLYDDRGVFILEKTGVVTLYAHRNSLAFIPAINTDKRIPVKATFEFTKSPQWFKSSDDLLGLSIIDKKYTEDETGSSLEVTVQNNTLYEYKNILVSVILSDLNGNVIGFSRTIIDSISPKGAREIAPFTWPIGRNGKVASIEVITTIAPMQTGK
jgi:hypothetical protein